MSDDESPITRRELDQRLTAINERFAMAHAAQALIDKTRTEAVETAIIKSEVATDKRFEASNAYREQLARQAATFATRESLESWQRESREAHEQLARADGDAQRTFATRETVDSWTRESRLAHETLASSIGDLSQRVANVEGRMFAYAGFVGIVVTVIEIALHFVKFGL